MIMVSRGMREVVNMSRMARSRCPDRRPVLLSDEWKKEQDDVPKRAPYRAPVRRTVWFAAYSAMATRHRARRGGVL